MTRAQVGAVTGVVSILLTGAFILEPLFGIPPLLDVGFRLFTGIDPPAYYGFAIGATGGYLVIYQFIDVIFIDPVSCSTDTDLEINPNFGVQEVTVTDFVNVFLIATTYNWILVTNDFLRPEPVWVGFLIIIVSFSFKIVPRAVSNLVSRDCFWTLKVVALSLPVCVLTFVPVMSLIAWL